MRAEVRFTVTAGRASKVHAPVVSPLCTVLTRWGDLDVERRAADDAVEDAHTEVTWAGDTLGEVIDRLSLRLLVGCGNDRKHPTFVAFFPEAPYEITRLGPEAKVERVHRWRAVRQEVKVDADVSAALDAVEAAATHGEVVLAARKEALDARARVSLRQKAWREEANTTRRAVEVALDQHALENGLPRGYSAKFFPKTPTKRKPKVADAKKADAKKADAKKSDVIVTKSVPAPAPARPSVPPSN